MVSDKRVIMLEVSTDEKQGLRYMLLRQRVAQMMDSTGWTSVLILFDVVVSVLSVVIYIVMTYQIKYQFLYDVQFAISIFFAANWLFWLWLAEDRLWYICSWMTVVDAITIIPSFVLYIIEGDQSNSLPGLSFLRALRIMRVARIFRLKDTFKEQLQGRVTEAALKLALCLVTVLVVAAGLFYELERYGVRCFGQSAY
eukprot:GHRR01035417.1.p1 GENE.GHRR01035417.1~~GHRR01035417.1.p1  ORF type:complete len:198 (+),score=36.88 GHRR01035417.1:450-1043(+)